MNESVLEPHGVAVFRGSRRSALECGLVLEAKGLPYELIESAESCTVYVPEAAAANAREELARYAAERKALRPQPPRIVPVGGAGIGAFAYVAVLLLMALLEGDEAFAIDWLSAGGLDAREGGAHEWWRAITALTLHVDEAHLLGNLLFGVGIGTLAGRLFGPGVAWASIVAAGALANYADMLIAPASHRAVGASTAVFAALGLVAGFAWGRSLTPRERLRYRWAPLFGGLCLLALLGAGDAHVDVLGHVLGFLAGIALGWVHARLGSPHGRAVVLQSAYGAATLALIVIAWGFALRHAPPLG